MDFKVTRLNFGPTARYPYSVRVEMNPGARFPSQAIEQQEWDDCQKVIDWMDESGLDFCQVALSFYVPTMKEATAILLRWS